MNDIIIFVVCGSGFALIAATVLYRIQLYRRYQAELDYLCDYIAALEARIEELEQQHGPSVSIEFPACGERESGNDGGVTGMSFE